MGEEVTSEHTPLSILRATVLTRTVRGVEGHFDHPHSRNWKDITDHVNPLLASLVGTQLSMFSDAPLTMRQELTLLRSHVWEH